jgi:type II secretory pathway component PulM
MSLSRAQSKAAAVSLAMFSLAIVWVFFLSPAFTVAALEHQKFSQNLERLSRFQSLQANADDVAESVRRIDGYVAPIYSGSNTSSVLAAMQRDIGRFATTSGANVGSIRPLNTSSLQEQGLQRLTLRVDLTGTTRQLFDFINEIRAHSALLVVARATIRAVDNGSAERAANISMSFELVSFADVVE